MVILNAESSWGPPLCGKTAVHDTGKGYWKCGYYEPVWIRIFTPFASVIEPETGTRPFSGSYHGIDPAGRMDHGNHQQHL